MFSELVPAFFEISLFSTLLATSLLIAIIGYAVHHHQATRKPLYLEKNSSNMSREPTMLSKTLRAALPNNVIFPSDDGFKPSMNVYWAQQACEVAPACVVRPSDTQQLSKAVAILKQEYDNRERVKEPGDTKADGFFAVRSGGHSPVPGASSIDGGVMIDLSSFSEVILSEDASTVVIGTGARWGEVTKILGEKGVAVVGGRNSTVGVGGLILGGGLSFFTPRFGLVCSNIISYELVLASGSIVTASETDHPDLWRALKGGSNNFGIVTRFTTRSFPSSKIWSGFLYMPSFQAPKVLAAFHEHVNKGASDTNAAGPLACFTYLSKLGIQAVSVNLVYTQVPEKGKKWPTCWQNSSFRSLFRLWSTCKTRTLNEATDEMCALNPPGRRQVWATTTIKNDPETLAAVHAAYRDGIASLRKTKDVSWTLVIQPTLPEWIRKGNSNPLGLDDYVGPLVNVELTVNWPERQDDEFINATTRKAIEQINEFAVAKGTDHPWRYLNYCADWQKPLESYGEENFRFLQEMSRKYDPEGMFQKGCAGGFKLGLEEK